MLKKFEKFKEIYKLDDKSPVYIKPEYIYQIGSMHISFPGGIIPSNFEDLRGTPGKMVWERDDFFAIVEFEKENEIYKFKIPVYALENEIDFKVRQYNL